MAYAVAQQQNSSSSLNTTVGQDASSSKSQLRGLSYQEGVDALSPDNVQLMPDASATQQSQQGGAVQLKGGKKRKWEKKKDLPDEIKALGLKKVKVHLEPGAWDHLEEDEKQGVINFLTMKEEEIQSAANKKSKRRIKRSTVTIRDRHVRALDEPELVTLEAGANANKKKMNEGEAPGVVEASPTLKGKIIGVDPGNVTVEQTYTTTTETVGTKEKVTKEADFKSGESTFLSAEYTQEKMLANDKIMQLMEQVKAQIEEFLEQDPNARITVTTEGSESYVTPPPSHPNEGDLAKARADNGEQLVKSYLASVEGLDQGSITFVKDYLGAQGPAWDPKGLSKSEVNALKMSDLYTRWQYVNFKVTAEMTVDGKEPKTITKTEVEETTKTDADIVTLAVTDKKKKRRRRKGGKLYGYQGNQKRVRGDGLVKGWRKDINKNSCGGAK